MSIPTSNSLLMQGMCSRYACVSLMCVFSLDRLNVASLKLEDVKFNILNVGSEGTAANNLQWLRVLASTENVTI